MTTVTPMATPPAIRNCGLASKANTAGLLLLMAARMPGDILASRFDSSASVSATAAIASGFACRDDMIELAVCCSACASTRRWSSFDMVACSSASFSGA